MKRLSAGLLVGVVGVAQAGVVVPMSQYSTTNLLQQMQARQGAYLTAPNGGGATVTANGVLPIRSATGAGWVNLATTTVANVGVGVLSGVAAGFAATMTPAGIGAVLAGVLAAQGISWAVNQWVIPATATPYTGIAPNVVPGYKYTGSGGATITTFQDTPDAVCQLHRAYWQAAQPQYGAVTITAITGGPVSFSCMGQAANLGGTWSYGSSTRVNTCQTGYQWNGSVCVWNAAQAPQVPVTTAQMEGLVQAHLQNNPAKGPDIFVELPAEKQVVALGVPMVPYTQTGTGQENAGTEITTYPDGTQSVVNTGVTYAIASNASANALSLSQVTATKTETTTAPNGQVTTKTTSSPAQVQNPATQIDPNTASMPQQSAPASDLCADHPTASACAELNTPDVDALGSKNIPVSVTPLSVGSGGSCPAPIPLPRGMSLSWQPECDFALMIKPLLLGLAWLVAGYIVIGGGREPG